jgi:hypothetical protein
VRPDDGKISDFCAEWATLMSDDPPIRKSNGFALQRKPNGGRITLNAASIWGISAQSRSAFGIERKAVMAHRQRAGLSAPIWGRKPKQPSLF